MGSRVLVSALLAAIVVATPLAAQQCVLLPAGSWATDVTPDGSVVVGLYPGGSFVWKWKQDSAPTFIPGGKAAAVSDDGKTVAGTIDDPVVNAEVAAIWTQSTGWKSLGWLPNAQNCPSRSNAYAISGDGTTVVGLSWNGCDGRGFRWTAATGMQELWPQGNGQNRCSAISRDGSALGGFAQGNFNRTPAYWIPFLTGAVLDMNFEGEVLGFNNNGSLSVGTLVFNTNNEYDAFIRDQQSGVITYLGHLNNGWSGNAMDISEDGTVIAGFDNLGLAREAWVWTAGGGVKSLNSRLAAMGVTGVPPLEVCNAMSDDGQVIVGGADVPGGGAGFIAQLSPLVPYGTGTPGCTGPELLFANELPRVNTPTFTLLCASAPPLSTGLWLVADAASFAGTDPFGLGVKLHVDLFGATQLFAPVGTSDANGLGSAPLPIPNSPVISGATFYAHVVWAWPASVCSNGPFGLSSSNGLAITILP